MTAIRKFQEQFGLDWVQGDARSVKPTPSSAPSPPPPPSTDLPPGLQDAILAYSSKVMSIVKSAPAEGIRLLDLADKSSIRMETLLPVMRYLTEKGLAERVAEDKAGNDAFRLTPLGQQLSS
jgi:hypothetical protein